MKRLTLSILAALSLSTGLWAQFSGNIEGSGLSNFDVVNKEDVKLNLKLDTSIVNLKFNLSGGHNYNPTQETTSTLDAKNSKSGYSKFEQKQFYKRDWQVSTGFNCDFRIKEHDVLNIGLQYQYKGNKDKPSILAGRYNFAQDSLKGEQRDTTDAIEHNIKPQLTYTHVFGKTDSKVYVGITGLVKMKNEELFRRTSGEYYARDRHYWTTSSLNDADTKIEAFYEDKSLGNVTDLSFKAGLDFVWHNDVDVYMGWNHVNNQWIDSVSLDRSQLYASLALEPNVCLSYKYKGLEFFVNERVQWYHHQLYNRLTEVTADQYEFRNSQWQNILAANIGYKFNNRHRLDLTYQRILERPDYEKLNPAIILGKSDGEYFQGNINLKPTTKDEVGLTYGFMAEHFGTDLTVGYRYTKDKVEKVIDRATADSTVFTWINAKKQHTGGLTLDLKVDYDAVKAKMWMGTYYDVFVKEESNKVDKTDFNFEVGMNLTASLTKDTRLASELVYKSAKASAYNLKGEYIGANIQLTHTFTILPYGRHLNTSFLDLYVKVNDLVDKPDYEETWNAAYTYYKVTEKVLNRRSVNIGINYKF